MPKDAPGEPNKRYGKLLTRLTGPSKPREMATIQAFCAWRDPSNGGRAVAFGAQTWSRAAPALRLSLPHRHLVNSVDWARWSAARTFDAVEQSLAMGTAPNITTAL